MSARQLKMAMTSRPHSVGGCEYWVLRSLGAILEVGSHTLLQLFASKVLGQLVLLPPFFEFDARQSSNSKVDRDAGSFLPLWWAGSAGFSIGRGSSSQALPVAFPVEQTFCIKRAPCDSLCSLDPPVQLSHFFCSHTGS